MSHFTDEIRVVNHLAGRVHDWELCEPLHYYLTVPDADTIHVPPGFVTDFASVPRPLWFWIAPWGRHGRAAVLHDFLYQLGSITGADGTLRRPSKREADLVFRQAMAVLDTHIITRCTFWRHLPGPVLRGRLLLAAARRWLMWAAVAFFGAFAYRRKQEEGSSPALEHEMLLDVEELLAAEGMLDLDAADVQDRGHTEPAV